MARATKAPRLAKNSVGERMKRLREDHLDLDRREFARKLKIAFSQVGMYEAGYRVPNANVLLKLGNIAASVGRDDEAAEFWKEAGVAWDELKRLTHSAFMRGLPVAKADKLWPVPVSKNVPEQAGSEPVPLPLGMLRPQPENVACARLSWAIPPLIFWPGTILIFDESDTDWQNSVGAHFAFHRRRRPGAWVSGQGGLVFDHAADQRTEVQKILADAGKSAEPVEEESIGVYPAFIRRKRFLNELHETELLTEPVMTDIYGTTVSFDCRDSSGRWVTPWGRLDRPGDVTLGRILAWLWPSSIQKTREREL